MPEGTHFGDVSIAEDVLAIIYQITPEDTPWYNMIGDSVANQPVHQWEERTLTTRQDNAQVEGGTYVFVAPELPTRVSNLTQIIAKFPRVSRTSQASRRHTIPDLVRDVTEQEMVKWKTDAEHALLRGSQASGNASNTARRMDGLLNAITTTTSAIASGTSLTEEQFNGLMQDVWNQGGKPRDALMQGTIKRRISSFVGNATKFFDQNDDQVRNTISGYWSDFTFVTTHLSRDMLSGANNNNIVVLDRDQFSKAWLDPVIVKRVADVADSLDHVVIGELCLEFGNEAAAGTLTALN